MPGAVIFSSLWGDRKRNRWFLEQSNVLYMIGSWLMEKKSRIVVKDTVIESYSLIIQVFSSLRLSISNNNFREKLY